MLFRSAAILPQMLASLGAVFLASGVGAQVGRLFSEHLALDTRIAAVATYCVGMALFTMLMGNAFAAFPVMTAAVGLPFVVTQFGGDPARVCAIGMLAGFCGTLMTPMAANFNMKLQSDNLFVVFRDGWHETEVGDETSGVEWQWSKKQGTVAFRNPKKDVWLYVQCDQPTQALGSPQHLELRIGTTVVDSFDLPAGRRELRKIAVPATALGERDQQLEFRRGKVNGPALPRHRMLRHVNGKVSEDQPDRKSTRLNSSHRT